MSSRLLPQRFRILHTLPDLGPGAEQLTVRQHLAFRDETRFDVHVAFFSAPTDLLDAFAATGATLHPLHRPLHERAGLVTDLVRLFRTRRIDLVHLHGADDALLGSLAAAAARIPVVRQVHAEDRLPSAGAATTGPTLHRLGSRVRSSGRHRLDRRSVAAYLADTREVADAWRQLAEAPVFTLTRGIEPPPRTAVSLPGEGTPSLVLPAGPVLLARCRRADGADPEWPVELLVRVRTVHPTAQLVLTGDAVSGARCRQLADRLGVGPAVHVVAGPGDDPALVALADVFVFHGPPTSPGLAALEALAAGLPTVTCRLAAHERIVEHGLTAMVVDGDDHVRFAAAVADLLHHPDVAVRLGEQARQMMAERCPADRTARSYERAYAHVLDRLVPTPHRPVATPTPKG